MEKQPDKTALDALPCPAADPLLSVVIWSYLPLFSFFRRLFCILGNVACLGLLCGLFAVIVFCSFLHFCKSPSATISHCKTNQIKIHALIPHLKTFEKCCFFRCCIFRSWLNACLLLQFAISFLQIGRCCSSPDKFHPCFTL